MNEALQRAAASLRAAQYVRMSTEHQNYSIEFQTAVNAAYALERNLVIVRTYADAGISGVRIDKREGLKGLLADVVSGDADFSVVLVYDVSRWGRFQDPDEAAHYEFICKAAGVRVDYCAEAFDNDGSLTSTLVKHVKRAMAAEFSRELSQRIYKTKRSLGLRGFWLGGNPGFGLRRCPVFADGRRGPWLEIGEQNAIKGRRMIVVAGPSEEVQTVRRIFQLFVRRRLSPNAIARKLNDEEVPGYQGRKWTQHSIRQVLADERHGGTQILGRERQYLGKSEARPEAEWLRIAGANEPIVPPRLFRDALRLRAARRCRQYSDDELLDGLRLVLAEKGKLSFNIIKHDPRTASPDVYKRRFGGLPSTYKLVGFTPSEEHQRLIDNFVPHGFGAVRKRRSYCSLTNEEIVERLRALQASEGRLTMELIAVTPGLPGVKLLTTRFGSLARVYALVGHIPSPQQLRYLGHPKPRRKTQPFSAMA